MNRTLNDTRRDVHIVIDYENARTRGGSRNWIANAFIDGEEWPGDALVGVTPGQAWRLIIEALEQSGALDDPIPPIPDNESLRLLIHYAANSWSGSEMPDWRGDEYARGQVELISNTCDVRTSAEEDMDGVGAKDRIMDWIRAENVGVRRAVQQ